MTRRDFIAASALAALARTSDAAPAKPNVLVILVDDLGYGDLSSYGAADMQTPHVDRIVAEGVRFDNAYANCPVCSPTRAALLTGRYQDLVGVPGVIRTHARDSWGHLLPTAKLLPVFLKQAGYKTAIVGKWHLGLESPNKPNDRGFDHFHGYLGDMMDDYYKHRRHGINYMRLEGETIDPKGHATDLFSQWACDYLKEQKAGKPFFLYLAYNAPHTPIQPPKEWVAKVKARQPGLAAKRAKLVALIEHMDDGIGQVMACLKDSGLDKDTLVIFTSDNGGQSGVGANNGPTRAGKGTVYEGGIRVPMAARWPGKIAAGGRTARIALSMDIFPTVLEAAGAAVPKGLDGVTFLPTLLGVKQAEPKRDLFFRRREGGPFKGKTIEAIRRGDWKLLRPMPGAPLELYNLAMDPLEKKNLAAAETKIFKELDAALKAQLKRYEAVPWQKP